MASPSFDKPLPQPPTANSSDDPTSRLSVESRAHLRLFINHVLAEENVEGGQEWVRGLELALNELCECLSKGAWLPGLRAARKARDDRQRVAVAKRRPESTSNAGDERGEKEGKAEARLKDRDSGMNSGANMKEKEKDEIHTSMPRKDRTAEERRLLAFEQIQKAIAMPNIPFQSSSPPAHFLLTLSSKGAIRPSHGMDFDISPSRKICIFTSEKVAIPSIEDWKRSTGDVILYGLDELDVDATIPPRIVGGTFSFAGISSAAQFSALSKVLRLSVYVCLSLLLEQCVLSDSHVYLHFPIETPAQSLYHSYTETDTQPRQGKGPAKHGGSGLWSLFAKKTETLLRRSAHKAMNSLAIPRVKSLEVSSALSARAHSVDRPSPPHSHPRKLSFSLIAGPSHVALEEERKKLENAPIFSSVLSQISASSSVLSTSAGVTFPPPSVITMLADKERENPERKLLGSEKTSLCSLLGWGGRECRGNGMSGLSGFARHQSITFLYAEYILRTCQEDSRSPSPISTQILESAKDEPLRDFPDPSRKSSRLTLTPERGRWVTYRYFSREFERKSNNSGDRTLGGLIESLSSQFKEVMCERSGCEKSRLNHRSVWLHGGVRISAEVCEARESDGQAEPEADSEAIYTWVSCSVCQKSTDRKIVSDGFYLFSFGKYLELLVYSPALCILSPRLCEHTTPPNLSRSSSNSPPQTRFNIVRHFVYKRHRHEVIFRVNQAPALFELRIPHLQFTRGRAVENGVPKTGLNRTKSSDRISQDTDEDKKTLRREIKQWWQCLTEHLDNLDEYFSSNEFSQKSLPRLPSCDNLDEEGLSTPKAYFADLTPLKTPSAPGPTSLEGRYVEYQRTPTPSQSADASTYPLDDALDQTTNPTELLNNLRRCFQRTEQSLYIQLSQTPNANLNIVRRSFVAASRGASRRLSAWEKKHVVRSEKKPVKGDFQAIEPEWWKPDCHTVPGSKVIVRENEWGTLIAFTLSSLDYQRELANMSTTKSGATDKIGGSSISGSSMTSSSYPPTTQSTTTSVTSTSSSATRSPDPDSDYSFWYELEPYFTVIRRQDHPRDPLGLMSLRDVLRQRRTVDTNASVFSGASKFSPSKFVSAFSGVSPNPRIVSAGTPPSAWAQPAVEVSMHAAGGKVSGLPGEAAESVEKILQDLDTGSETTNTSAFFHPWRVPGSPDPNRDRRPPSLTSSESDRTEPAAIVPTPAFEATGFLPSGPRTSYQPTSSMPVDSARGSESSSTASLKIGDLRDSSLSKTSTATGGKQAVQYQRSATPPSVTTSLASTVTSAMRFFLNQGEVPRPTSPSHHHKLLALDTQSIEDRPHIRHEWTIGKRLRFSCTVYYAKQFEYLRRRCGVDMIYPTSLERSENWAAEGGKSRSNFWKTNDNRFVIKTLVDAWNVADLQVLIELGPAYFRYMESSASRPSVLAKLLGFYTVEIKNLESGSVQTKADLLVMENVFYDRKVTKTFDLKGIQGRKVKTLGGSAEKKTLLDGDWIEDQQKTLILIQPHSKLVLNEAIKADADFLCKNNIMDYSLLLGVDETQRQITCGLVDMIGSYTFAKTLEYKAKQNLKSGKEVTVIPPNEYHDRFTAAMGNYFIACPDKWSRPLFDSSSDKLHYELTLLSVL